MSKVLAPIHYNMYNKINNQDQINKDLANAFGDEALMDSVSKEVGSLPEGDLMDVVDHGNIHGWLQSKIDVVESGFSKIVKALLDKGVSKDELLTWFEERGRKENAANTGEAVFLGFTNAFLDGMPCDRAIQPVVLEDDQAKWVQTIDVHAKFWDDNGALYNDLRCAWIKGVAQTGGFEFQKTGGVYEVKR